MSTTTPIFTAGGLASGLDTNSIVDKLVALESQPITKNTALQAAMTVQISSLGDLSSKIKALASSASSLSTGVATSSIVNTPPGVSAVAGTGALPGRYSITVNAIATTAKARSGQFDSANSTIAGGKLDFHVKGTAYSVTLTANSDLGSVAQQINASGAPVNASVITDGTKFYLSFSNRDTGKPIGSAIDGGLTVDNDPTGLGLHVTQDAVNASVLIDDLPVDSQSNQISTAIPGVTLNVVAKQTTAADLVVSSDASKSKANLQGFVDSYNAIIAGLQQSLRPDPKAPPAPGSTLDGSLALGLERKLQSLISAQVVANGAHRTLADIGVKMQNDGTLTLDSTTFNAAIGSDPRGVDAIFSTASTGIAAQTKTLSTTFTDSINGQLVQRQTSLKKNIKDLDTSNLRLQQHVDSFKAQLQSQFTRMESLIANYNSIGTFLNNSASFSNSNKSK
jgi:flagellar hook-associated protein 2